ncbi:uncharacterized protein LOC106130205 [Amyelois transitella]|uniref:uncharacterized protein LOC106130205 n=1 Tax=Amyelois transitella TaxID=680683 RepID=UPI00067BC687|nr:uncharacterized protein LOC106130205 [Amyelois transitella]
MDMTKKLTKDLIEMYWERKCLWKVNSKEYKKRDMKNKAYHEMVMFLRKNGIKNANAKLVREKIQNLRRAMRKEKKRIDSSGGAYSPTLWYYDLLMFVNDQYEDTTCSPSLTITDSNDIKEINCDVVYSDTDEEKIDEETICENSKSPKSAESHDVTTDDNKDNNFSYNNNNKESKENCVEFEAVGINFTAKLKRMESKQQIFAELLIQKVLARGLLGQLNEMTDIVDKV